MFRSMETPSFEPEREETAEVPPHEALEAGRREAEFIAPRELTDKQQDELREALRQIRSKHEDDEIIE